MSNPSTKHFTGVKQFTVFAAVLGLALTQIGCQPTGDLASDSNSYVVGELDASAYGGTVIKSPTSSVHSLVATIVHSRTGGICTGTWIGVHSLLTAGHCLTDLPVSGSASNLAQYLHVTVGANAMDSSTIMDRLEVQSFVVHPEYQKLYNQKSRFASDSDFIHAARPFDIAIVRVKPVRRTLPIVISPIADKSFDIQAVLRSKNSLVSVGFGSQEEWAKQNAQGNRMITKIERDGFARVVSFDNMKVTENRQSGLITIEERDQGLCSGDSGAPLAFLLPGFINDDMIGVVGVYAGRQFGLLSTTPTEQCRSTIAEFVDVRPHAEWINQTR